MFSPFSVAISLDLSIKLTVDMGDVVLNPSAYRRLIGNCNFLQHAKPNIAYYVQYLSQFLQSPRVPHMKIVLYVLRYLISAPAQGILLTNSPNLSLLAFSDSDWATCDFLGGLL